MSVFPDWQQFIVAQKNSKTGCIPTGYEIILRAAGVTGIDFSSFQDEFDLKKNNKGSNNFQSVADAIMAKYPGVCLEVKIFDKSQGLDKLRCLEKRLTKELPTLVSLALKEKECHIMPVVDADDSNLIFFHSIHSDDRICTLELEKKEFVRRHNEWDGGDDIAYVCKG